MTSLLFAIAYWIGIFWAACGAVVLLTFIWFCIEERVYGPVYAHRPIWADPPTVARPYDQDDPLERLFALPSHPCD